MKIINFLKVPQYFSNAIEMFCQIGITFFKLDDLWHFSENKIVINQFTNVEIKYAQF